MRRPRVLLVAPYQIYPPVGGCGVRNWNLLRQLAGEVDFHAFVFASTFGDPVQEEQLRNWCREVFVHRRDPVPPAGPYDLEPRNVQFFGFQEVRERLRDIVATRAIDVVQLEYLELGQYAELFSSVPVILTEHDLTFVTSRRRRALGFHCRYEVDRMLWGDRFNCDRLLRYEVLTCDEVDEVHVMSGADGRHLAHYLKDGWRRVVTMPNGVDTNVFSSPPVPSAAPHVLFLGTFGHTPNRDGLRFLVNDVWPKVRARVPAARLVVVGAQPPPDVLDLDGRDAIDVVGTVDNTVPWLQSARVLAATIRAGSGTRLKILEAMACGLPVVSTTIGSEGLEAVAGEDYLRADAPEDLAAALVRVLTDDVLREHLAVRGRAVAIRYEWGTIAQRLLGRYLALARVPRFAPAAGPTGEAEIAISVIIPTRNGGERLRQCLDAVLAQRVDGDFEVVCVDSGSSEEELKLLDNLPVRVHRIPPASFNHGLTRDLGARLARGRVLVFLNQDAVPADPLWLAQLTAPLARPGPFAAVQGGIREFPNPEDRFFWDSGGDRFYFTSESRAWIKRFHGLGFSTVNAAIRRTAWEQVPFGWAPIMEDKKWQRQAAAAGMRIASAPAAFVYHSHIYGFHSLLARCRAEGQGWALLGERYSFAAAWRDMRRAEVWREWRQGLRRGRLRGLAGLSFPLARPMSVLVGNRFDQPRRV